MTCVFKQHTYCVCTRVADHGSNFKQQFALGYRPIEYDPANGNNKND